MARRVEIPEVVVSTVVSSLTTSIKDELRNLDRDRAPTIHRIPIYVRRGNESAYTPTFVSIGPYHRNLDEQTKGTKISYLKNFLDRTGKDMKIYASPIKDREDEARNCYADRCNKLGSKEFVQMMVLDGCFIVEFLLEFKQNNIGNTQKWWWRHLRNDLILMENQIPFFILKLILDNSGLDQMGEKLDILDLCLHYLHQEEITKGKLEQIIRQEGDGENVYHLLHLSYLFHRFDPKWQKVDMHNRPKEKAEKKKSMIRTATQLNEFGVTFQRKKDPKNITDVRFENGIMEIPEVVIDDSSSSTLRNYLALEHNCPNVGNTFSSYALFMDYLVDTASDVALLKKRKIIVSRLGCDEDVAKLFNGIAAGLVFDNNYLEKHFHYLFEDPNTWKGKPSKYLAILKRDYLSSPWKILSLLGGLTLLAFSATQVTYAVKNYHRM